MRLLPSFCLGLCERGDRRAERVVLLALELVREGAQRFAAAALPARGTPRRGR